MHTLIIGGGLSGLALARALQEKGQSYTLLEARARYGGRIKTASHAGCDFDLGPAWFWPGQPRIAALIERLGLEKFDQYSDGILTYEDERGHVQRGQGYAFMQGSWRLKGGLSKLTEALVTSLPETHKHLNAQVIALMKTADGVTATLKTGQTFTADRVVLALPPRIASEIGFTPALPDNAITAMRAIPTWMAGQAKAIAVYDTPFWRKAGLSGDAMSRFGPMVEVHDASPLEGKVYGLFGFIGVPPKGRKNEGELRKHVLAQLERLFGAEAAKPSKLFIKDWASDPYTATQADMVPLATHPAYALPQALIGLWENSLLFGGTEVAPEFGGYIEGALEAAENILRLLDDDATSMKHAD